MGALFKILIKNIQLFFVPLLQLGLDLEMVSNLTFLKLFLSFLGLSVFGDGLQTPKLIFLANTKPIHDTRFKTHPILIPVFGVSMGWLAAPGPSWPPIWGLGGSPKTSSRTSSRMPSKGLWPHKCPRMLLLGISTLDLGGPQ